MAASAWMAISTRKNASFFAPIFLFFFRSFDVDKKKEIMRPLTSLQLRQPCVPTGRRAGDGCALGRDNGRV